MTPYQATLEMWAITILMDRCLEPKQVALG